MRNAGFAAGYSRIFLGLSQKHGEVGYGTVFRKNRKEQKLQHENLSADQIADHYRTPLRDALTLLEKEGWVEQNGKIRMVAPLLWRNILELLEIREPIDMLGFELAFYKYTPEDFAHLHGILQEMMDVTKQDHGSYYSIMALDTSFHRYINRKSGNSILFTFSEEINEKVTRASILSMKYSGKDGNAFAQEHLAILKCMESGDYENACRYLSEHYSAWRQRMLSLPGHLGFDPANLDTKLQEEFVTIDK